MDHDGYYEELYVARVNLNEVDRSISSLLKHTKNLDSRDHLMQAHFRLTELKAHLKVAEQNQFDVEEGLVKKPKGNWTDD